MTLESFVAKQFELLELERDAEIEENRCLRECSSLKDLQKKGVCIPKLRLAGSHTGLFGRFINTFEPFWPGKPLPCHNIRSGDIVGVGHLTSDGKQEIIASGVVTHVKEESVSIAMEKGSEEFSMLESDVQYLIIKLANDITYKRLKKALKFLNQERSKKNARLIDVLFGNLKPTCATPIGDGISFFNQHLNETQHDAVKLALSQKEVSLVHGPPGTGKTTTVVEIIMQAVGQKLKVLACAPSNVAVDNLVEKLSLYKVKMIRLGHPARFLPGIHKYSLDAVVSNCDSSRVTDDIRKEIDKIKAEIEKTKEGAVKRKLWAQNKQNLRELKEREKSVISEVLRNADVVLCTLTSATSDGPIQHLPKEHFDITVIDECSQALEASCWISLLHVPRCVLAGDHHQLPPTIISDKAAKEGLAETLMERLIKLHGNGIVKMLNIQYRMHQKIMEWPSKQLYDGKLEAHSSVKSHLLRDIPGVEDNENTSLPLLFIDTAGCDLDELDVEDEESKGNEGEADLVSCHVETLIKSGVESLDIAVITPYNLQVDFIKYRLASKYPHLEVKSVDGFQGREKEAVVLSLVRSNAKGEVGFLAEDRRINVAVTRAKRHLAVICNSETVSHHPFLKSFVDYISTEGEVRSASQYEDDIGHYPKFSSHSVASDKPKATSESSCKKKEKPSFPKAKGSSQKQSIRRQEFSEQAEKVEDRVSCTINKELRAEKYDEFHSTLKLFVENSEESILKFSPHLTAFERRIVHEICEEFGLLHVSQGEGTERYIEVKKSKPSQCDNNEFSKKLFEEAKQHSDSDSNKTQQDSNSVNNPSNECTCSLCNTSIPCSNFELHRVYCEKVSAVKEKKVKPVKTKQAPASKNKISIPHDASTLSDVDFDAIIEATVKSNNTCAQNKCKKSVTTLGQECQFCRSRFCYAHFMPEVHGCGDAAKAHARHQIRKEGKLYPGSGKPQKSSSDAVKHAQLQNKLNKKLADLSNQRKTKPKN